MPTSAEARHKNCSVEAQPRCYKGELNLATSGIERKSKLKVMKLLYLTKVIHEYKFEMYLKVILKNNPQVISLSSVSTFTLCLPPVKQKSTEPSGGRTFG